MITKQNYQFHHQHHMTQILCIASSNWFKMNGCTSSDVLHGWHTLALHCTGGGRLLGGMGDQ